MQIVKIIDVGAAPLDGRQEQFWQKNIVPKFERLRPGLILKYTPQETILKKYNFKAFEYGHYTTQNERFDFLAAAQASFTDLQKVTGFKSLGFDLLGVAFGARGMGGNAAAHFEPGSYMINLTRKNGYNSFAHEYGHAIDYAFGHYAEPDMTSRSLSGGASVGARSLQFKPGETSLYSMRALMKMVLIRHMISPGGEMTESYKKLNEGSGGAEYWLRHTEIFARIFEQWVQYQLEKKGISNYFLTKHKYPGRFPYMTEKDFKIVLPYMNRLIKKMAERSKIKKNGK